MENSEITSTTTPEPVSAPPTLVKKGKPGRKPRKQLAPAPAPPSPTILAFENEMISLVQQRGRISESINAAKMAYETASVQLRMAQEQLMAVEREVQYRLQLIQQLKGGQPASNLGLALQPSSWDVQEKYNAMNHIPGAIHAGVGSISAMQSPALVTGIDGRKVRSESAEGFRSVI